MPDLSTGLLDPTRILFDLQQGNEIAQRLAGCLEPEEIARRVTDGLVEKFDCAFARLWLLEPDQTALKLVASSGMYTNTNGFFGRVPMGAYKVGKIAQNRISFLSNNLAAESWVGNREWAIANNIRGFAGYPLVIQDRTLGVLATFSHHPLEAEFLEVLQTLCTMAAIALDTALQHQTEKQRWRSPVPTPPFNTLSLSDHLAATLTSSRLTLVGTEPALPLPLSLVFLQAAEALNRAGCIYCRLTYTIDTVDLEAVVPVSDGATCSTQTVTFADLERLLFPISCLGGVLQTKPGGNQKVVQVLISIPYPSFAEGQRVRVQCRFPVLQMAFTHLAFLAGLTVCNASQRDVPLLTDDLTQVATAKQVLWIQQPGQATPKEIKATLDLSISSAQLREAVDAVARGDVWGSRAGTDALPPLSEREIEMMTLLAQGLRDRDIANRLIISESTVKFHINNILAKVKARTRYQALHHVIVNGWIQ